MKDENYNILVKNIERAMDETGKRCDYIITDDLLGFEQYGDVLIGNNYVIRQFGEFYVAFIF